MEGAAHPVDGIAAEGAVANVNRTVVAINSAAIVCGVARELAIGDRHFPKNNRPHHHQHWRHHCH